MSGVLPGMWQHIDRLRTRRSFLPDSEEFEPDSEHEHPARDALAESILVVGAGGLGCELLKDLALVGFSDIHVIDMDTIDLSNLNRQFLFRQKDIGHPKATTAAAFVMARVPGVTITPHYCKIQDKDDAFYRQFKLVVCGLDSIIARRWMNTKLVSLVERDQQGNVEPDTVIPMIDGGTEGFQGHCKIIVPGVTPCFECLLPMFPPATSYALCTLQSTPRLPEHCAAWAKILAWPEQKPFTTKSGAVAKIDTDNVEHMQWLFETAKQRAEEFSIEGVTFKLTQGVVKNIIPAIASTNAIIAAACANEALKARTMMAGELDNYFYNNGTVGNYMMTVAQERDPECLVCNQTGATLKVTPHTKLAELLDILKSDPKFQLKDPGLTKGTPLYYSKFAEHEERLEKTLSSLGVSNGTEIVVQDPNLSGPCMLTLLFSAKNPLNEG